jgi:hypothetical protein
MGFLSKLLMNPWVLLAVGIFFISSLVGAYHFGVTTEEGRQAIAQQEAKDAWDKERTEMQAKFATLQEGSANRVRELEAKLLKAKQNVRVVTQQITKEVPIYVSEKADTQCVIPTGFVSLWNRSTSDPATGSDTSPAPEAGVVFDAPSGVALSAVAAAAIENHAAYWELRTEITARDEYIDELLLYIQGIREIRK